MHRDLNFTPSEVEGCSIRRRQKASTPPGMKQTDFFGVLANLTPPLIIFLKEPFMTRKRVFILSILAALALFSAAVIAGGDGNTIVYPEKNPIFSVTFPDDWKTETEEDIVHAYPADESIYLGIWALEDAKNLDAALDAVDEAVASLVKNLKIDDPETMTVNEIEFMTCDGTGIDNDGDKVNVSVALFSPDEKQIFILLYYGTPEAEDAHEDELVGIVKSINGEE
jgi:hypothetical protein